MNVFGRGEGAVGELVRIKTPWKQQWKQVRHQLVPLATFGLAAVLALYFWSGNYGSPTATGEVKLAQAAVSTPYTGVLARLPGKQLDPMDPVEQGQVVARLDDHAVRLQLTELQGRIAGLRQELTGEREGAESSGTQANVVRRGELRLMVLEQRTHLLSEKLEAARGGAHSRDVARQTGNRERDIDAARAELAKINPTANAGGVTRVDARIAAAEAGLDGVELAAQGLEVRAPFDGVVSDVHKVPGQTVMTGEPIVTISRPNSEVIVSYVRQEQRITPVVDEEVSVRRRYNGGKGIAARVTKVGQHLELIPLHQLRDPKTPEWGLPVMIELPTGMEARPGELVDVRFLPRG